MECGICMEAYDSASRRPKMFPCGHSACLACVQGFAEKRCPECRREFACKAENLADNFTVLRLMESSSKRPRMWCIDCKAIAKPECYHDHTLKSAKNALKDEVEQLQMRAAQVAGKLPEGLRQDGDGCPEQAMRVLQLARQPGSTLEVSVRGDGGEALTATWTNPPAAPAGQQSTAEAVATDVLVLALAKKGVWQQRGTKRPREGEEGQEEGQERAEDAPVLPPMEELEVGFGLTEQRKAELQQTVTQHRVRRLTEVPCYQDPAWTLQLLRLAAPHLEELKTYYVRREHLLAVLAMPRLRRLAMHGNSTDQSDFPAGLPPLPAHRGLRWLHVSGLPRGTTFNLLRAHAGTLERLSLYVGTPGKEKWPRECDDLHTELAGCRLARLRRLVLGRASYHEENSCPAQLRAVRLALPTVQVQCSKCDQVEFIF